MTTAAQRRASLNLSDIPKLEAMRGDDCVCAGVSLNGSGELELVAENIRKERTGIHAEVTLTLDGQRLAYDTFNIGRMEERAKLARSAGGRAGMDAGYVEILKVHVDEFASQVWDTWIDNDHEVGDMEVHEFLGQYDPPPVWVVRGLMEQHERCIVTAGEGMGKSTLLRQIAVMVAAGTQPFDLDEQEPKRVLIVDAENSPAHVRRKLRPLVLSTKGRLAKDMLRVGVGFKGLDLLSKDDGQRLRDRVKAHRAELLVIGPNYKLASGDPLSEETARTVTGVLDQIREDCGCAILMESHSPHASNGSKRPWRPYGASLWLRWPEYGLYVADDGKVGTWRGSREERAWPKRLKRGGAWPWTVDTGPDEGLASDAQIDAILRSNLDEDGKITKRDAERAVREAGVRASGERISAGRHRLMGDGA